MCLAVHRLLCVLTLLEAPTPHHAAPGAVYKRHVLHSLLLVAFNGSLESADHLQVGTQDTVKHRTSRIRDIYELWWIHRIRAMYELWWIHRIRAMYEIWWIHRIRAMYELWWIHRIRAMYELPSPIVRGKNTYIVIIII